MKIKHLFFISIFFTSVVIYAQDHTICANEIVKLHAGNHQSGSLQWQISYDNINWADIDNANEITYEFQPTQSAYYRVLNKFAYCEPNASPTSLVLVKPTAITSKNRTINSTSEFISGNKGIATTSTWTILEGENGILSSPDNFRTKLTGELGQVYKLLYTLENQCGVSTDTLRIKLEMPQFYHKIVVVDDTDNLLSTPEQIENGEYVISFNNPVPTIDDETILLSLVDDGFMRKVDSFTTNGNTFTLQTSQAYLDDFITSGTVDLGLDTSLEPIIETLSSGGGDENNYIVLSQKPTRYDLLNDPKFQQNKRYVYFGSPSFQSNIDGVMLNESLSDQETGDEFEFTYSFNDVEFETDLVPNLSLVYSGLISIKPNFKTELNVIQKRAKIGIENLEYDIDLNFTGNIDASTSNFEYEKVFGTFEKPMVFFLGAVPILVTTKIQLKGKAKFELDAGSFGFGIHRRGVVNAFLEYNNGQVTNNFNHNTTYSGQPHANLSSNMTTKVSLGPVFSGGVFGMPYAYLDVNLTNENSLCVSLNQNYSLESSFKLKARLGMMYKASKITIFDIYRDFDIYKFWDSKSPFQLQYISGNYQSYTIGSTLENPFKVKVISNYGVSSPFVKLNFDVLNSSGTLSQNEVITNSNGEAEVNFTPTGSNISQVRVTAKNCEDKNINSAPFTFTAHNNVNTTCENTSLYASIIRTNTTIQPKGNLGTPPYTFSTDGTIFNATAPIITPTGDNVYNFTVKDANNCVALVSHQGSAFSCDDTDLGVSATIFGNTLNAEGYGGTPPYQYALVPQSPNFGINNIFSNVPAGSFLLRIKDANNCLRHTTVELTDPNTQLIAYFDAPQNAQPNQNIQLNNYSNNATSYSWDFGNGQTSTAVHPSISYTTNGTYTITLTASNGTTTNDYTRTIIIGTGQSNPFGIQTVPIPAGTFIMGSPTTEPNRDNDETQHQVTLSAFTMSKYEITCAQYAAFLNAVGVGSDCIWATGPYPTQVLFATETTMGLTYTSGQWTPAPNKANAPMVRVNWFGATSFAQYAGGRLPTEAEWEYAARGGTTTAFNTGACLSNTQANYAWSSPQAGCSNTVIIDPYPTQNVGLYPSNVYGLHDMHGNVSEWCSDWYGNYPSNATTNPTGSSTGWGRVVRGGGWSSNASECRSAERRFYQPHSIFISVGFRLVF